MALEFRKSERKNAKLRLGLVGPAGFGKSYSALRIAKGMGGKVAMLDTEAGSGDLYANDFDYDILRMNAPFTPEKYIMAIEAAEENGYDILIVDSLSHAWAGEGGLLDKHGAIADKGGNSFAAWRTVTPLHNKLVEKLLQTKLHVIVTLRAKPDYTIEAGKVIKLGLAPIQKEGLDYEFTVVFDVAKDHKGHTSKDRTKLFDNQIVELTEETGKQLMEWLNVEKAA